MNGPESPLLNGLSLGASLTVANLQQSVDWYRDVLGFTVERQHEREGTLMAVSLRAGEVRILLTQDDGSKGVERAKGVGFSLMITTDQSIDALAARVRDAGVAFDTEPTDTPWGARMFRVHDPDGFRYTIATEPGRSQG